jgi:conjugative transposon TraN protein
MCSKKFVWIGIILLFIFQVSGQSVFSQPVINYTAPAIEQLEITTNQTTTLVFPASIKSVDRGDAAILARTIKGIANVLKVKAAIRGMTASNLTVFTGDGAIYSFRVVYVASPSVLLLDYSHPAGTRPSLEKPLLFSSGPMTETEIARYADTVTNLPRNRSHPRAPVRGGIHLQVNGLFLCNGVLYLRLKGRNDSPVPYNIDFLHYYIKDKHQQKRVISMEQEVHPILQQFRNGNQIAAGKTTTLVVAFDQFTISDQKKFTIEMFEKNGDRRLTCSLKGKHLLQLQSLSQ